MRPYGGENAGVLVSEFDGTLQCATIWIACADIQDDADTCVARAPDYFVTIGVKLGTVDMRVRVYEHCLGVSNEEIATDYTDYSD